MNDFAEPDVLDPELPDEFVYLNTVGSDRSAMWTVIVSVNGRPSQFKVDTGAEVTVISSAASTQLGITDPQPMTKQLRGPDGTPLCMVGQATLKLAYQGRECTHTLFVMPSLEHNLLGHPAIRYLHDLQKVDSLGEPPQAQFPSLFTGLGELKGDPYKMQLKADATPFPLNTARNVPLPLREKVQAELQRMHASTGCHCPSRGAHTLVFWHGGSAQSVWPGTYLCGLSAFGISSAPEYFQQ